MKLLRTLKKSIDRGEWGCPKNKAGLCVRKHENPNRSVTAEHRDVFIFNAQAIIKLTQQ